MTEEAAVDGEASDKGDLSVNMKYSMDDEIAGTTESNEATEDGSFQGGWVFLLGWGLWILGIYEEAGISVRAGLVDIGMD